MRRRQVFGVLALYIRGAWVVLQVADTLFPGWRIPEEAIRFVWIGAVLLFPIAVVFGWFYDVSTLGIHRTAPAGSDVMVQDLNRTDYGALAVLTVISLVIGLGVAREVVALRTAPELPPIAAVPVEAPDTQSPCFPSST